MNAISRILKMNDRGRNIEIPVRISWPVEERTGWLCKWEIGWPDRTRTNSARGFDAVQALINALQMVGSEIYCSEEHKTGRLSWAAKWTGYGFPVPNNIRDLLIGDDRKSL